MTKSLRILTVALACKTYGIASPQIITFDPIVSQTLGGSPFTVAAESSANLAITFTSSTPAVCRVASNLVTLYSVGSCSITASLTGNSTYSPASVTRTFTVTQGKPSGTLAAAAGSPFATSAVPLAGPLSAVTGDFNGDGNPDIAMTVSSGDIAVLLGKGSGTFGPASLIHLEGGLYPNSITTGDFNGDSIPDIATANLESNNVTIFLGNGSGGFTESGTFLVGAYPYSIVTGDFNGDGLADLATANDEGGTVTILLGDGLGGFAEARGSPFATQGEAPVAITVADFNGDGIQDLAVADFSSDSVTVFLGGAGGFTAVPSGPFATGTGPSAVAAGDFDGDGVQDLAVANLFDNDVTILIGDGKGSFHEAMGSPFPVGSAPLSVAVGDFNGDGYGDIVTANNGNNGSVNNITVLLGNGAGGFTPIAGDLPTAGTEPGTVLTGDFNRDGILDAALANYGSNDLTVLLGGPAPTASTLSTPSQLSVPSGQAVPLVLSVSDTTGAFSAPTGSVTFSNGGTIMGTATQNSGLWTFVANALSDGTHTVTAAYGGDARSLASTSNTLTIRVGGAPQSISFDSLPPVILPASPFALTATASSGLAVSFASSTPQVCTVAGTILTPVAAGTCTVSANQAGDSVYAGANPVTQTFTVSPATPQLTGIANAASAGQAPPQVVAPGTYVAIYGTGLTGNGSASALTLPLPTMLDGVQITLGGVPLPLLYASDGQVNGLVPQKLAAHNSYPLVVTNGSSQSPPVMLQVQGVQPGIYTVDTSGSGPGIIANALTGQLVSTTNPAHISDFLAIYCTGLGTVTGANGEAAPADGAAAPASPVFNTDSRVTATIGNITAPVTFSGLTASFASLYQVNVKVPEGVSPGNAVTIVITATDSQTGETAISNTVTIAVQ